MSSQTLTLDCSTLFLEAHRSLSLQSPQTSPPLSFSLIRDGFPLPPVPSDFPQSKLIPKTRFVVDGFRYAGDFSISYFLSHFHSDHYTGLAFNWSRGIIFCSDTTRRLLVEVLKIPSRFIVPLSLSKTVLIDGCEVTVVDANHCPGAVQFLFKIPGIEGRIERYVHTGDFRYRDSMKLEPILSEFIGSDAIFLDTTYCNPKFVFPSQEESVDYIVGVIERIGVQNEGSPKSVLFLVATYVIGKEKILLEISRRCNRKIYVDGRKMAILSVLGLGRDEAFTEEESKSDVHVVGWNVLGDTWPYFRPNFVKMKEVMDEKGYSKVVGFVPTGWTYEVKRNKFAVRSKDVFDIHLVPYSEHSNYDELREYVRFLKPKRVIPTVGVDVEKLDSKHANSMRKHFTGLVDEMAIKQEFLMGFNRWLCEEDNKVGKDTCSVQNKMDQLKEFQSPVPKENEEIDEGSVLDSSSGRTARTQDLAVLSDQEKEEMIQQLHDCLPSWVTQNQINNLLTSSGGNVVEAVSNFYERETEFHEQITTNISSACMSQPSAPNESASVVQPGISITTCINVDLPLGPNFTTLSTKNLTKSNVSPGKKKRSSDKKPNKKPGTLLEKCMSDEIVFPADPLKLYKEEVDQFIHITNESESLRSYAAGILEETEGDINKALDKYYSNPEISLDGNKHRLVETGRSVQAEPSDRSPCSPKEKLVTEVIANKRNLPATGSSPENASSAPVSLPLEKYSPVEHACWKPGQPAPYIHLARTFELVEDEKGKIKAMSMLCNMFRSLLALSPEDVLPAVYLCTNKIAPDHENKELNIGGSTVVAAMEEACGTNRSKVKELYDCLGDLGDVAQRCRQTQSLLAPQPPLSVKGVYSVLRKISEHTGSGSTVRKKGLIVNLMRACREKEMKFLVRTLVRNLRIGAMMRTILPALAQAVVLNSCFHEGTVDNLKETLQRLAALAVEAYNILPNLDLLVPSLLEKGIEFSSTTLSMVPGIPIKPMLAKITNGISPALKIFQNKAFTCEYKYDGQRAQIHRLADGCIRIFSRNGDETTSRFPDLVNIIQESCSPTAATFIVDAEVVAVDRKHGRKLLSFQELSSRERGSKDSLVMVDSIKVDICVFVFDIMFANGEQLLNFPLRWRRKYLKDLFGDEKLGYFEYAKETTVEADDACLEHEYTLTKMKCFLDEAICSSCEGIMVKSLDVDATYSPSRRSDSWLKVKRDYVEGLGDSLDLVPIGAWHGNGRKAGWYSPFLMACYEPDTQEFQSVCRVMSGFSDSFYIEMKEYFSGDKVLSRKPLYYQTDEVPDMWFSSDLVWEIKGADLTVSPVHKAAIGLVHPSRGISVRFPRFIRTLPDRRPEDCSTAAEVAEMFHSQTRKMDVSSEN
ncbi:DNA ligase (ATP) [Bertholletia excelsa]